MAIRYVASEPGAALQRNVGIDLALCDVVVFIDDDCTVEPGLFEVLTSAYGDPSVVGATGRIYGPSCDRLGSDPHSRLRWLLLGGGRQFFARIACSIVSGPACVAWLMGYGRCAGRVL
jgi:glycosyltransferase involved in cell wall biosynthesis